MSQTTLTTERLVLRPFRRDDADAFRRLAGDWDVAKMTSDIPHPLSTEQARQWLDPAYGEMRFAIELDGKLMGGCGYFERTDTSVELGFWLGKAYWGHGYATEAARAVVAHGFTNGSYQLFTSAHFADNPASARVIAKLGFRPVGREFMWSLARGNDVETVKYELTQSEAIANGTLNERPASPRRWSMLLSRFAGNA